MKNKNDEILFNIENQLKETSDTLLHFKSDNSNETADITDRKEDYMSLKIEKDNFLDNQSNKNDIEKNTFYSKKIINLRRFGNTFPLFFKNGEPTIVIGPHCNYNIIFILFIKKIRAFFPLLIGFHYIYVLFIYFILLG